MIDAKMVLREFYPIFRIFGLFAQKSKVGTYLWIISSKTQRHGRWVSYPLSERGGPVPLGATLPGVLQAIRKRMDVARRRNANRNRSYFVSGSNTRGYAKMKGKQGEKASRSTVMFSGLPCPEPPNLFEHEQSYVDAHRQGVVDAIRGYHSRKLRGVGRGAKVKPRSSQPDNPRSCCVNGVNQLIRNQTSGEQHGRGTAFR